MAEVDGVRALKLDVPYIVAVVFAVASGVLTQYHVYDYGPAVTFGLFSIGWFALSARSANAANSQSTSETSEERQKQNNESHS
jgi:hypothetical protein